MAGVITIEYNRDDLIELILEDVRRKMPGAEFEKRDIQIEVKSKQNYKAEWENADYRARVQTRRKLNLD